MGRRIRIGIDVGGTFTDVVAADHESLELIGQLKLPTTHHAPEGVARGIVEALERALAEFRIAPGDVAFIAHSTTQATNALLEGDVASVGILGMGSGVEAPLARRATAVPPIPLTSTRRLEAVHRFVRIRRRKTGAVEAAVRDLASDGVAVVVASAAFGVDDPGEELRAAETARRAGLLATSGHEVSGLYGLRVRTRTAVLNAAVLPKMVETAAMTERCAASAGIGAPLMIMRSDGGVMSVREVQRRPILTMLSGPAAGVAGALLHERVSDGIFVEVGGTSADLSVIRDGTPVVRPATIGGHRMYLDTLDVRTIGVAGGSLVRVALLDGRAVAVADVGPRSAHIAGLGYACFADPAELEGSEIMLIEPAPGDASDHAVLETRGGRRFAVTPTCAANLLGVVPRGNFADGYRKSAELAFRLLAEAFAAGTTPAGLAEEVLRVAAGKLVRTIAGLAAAYRLEPGHTVLVGGGGAAAVLVPYAARLMGAQHRLARNAEVISPLGVAMAMVRDTVERNIVDPSPQDVLRVRRAALEAAVSSGALPETVEVQVEVDRRRNLVRASAAGTTDLRPAADPARDASEGNCRAEAARSMRVEGLAVRLVGEAGGFRVYESETTRRRLFGMVRSTRPVLRVVDRYGRIRLQRGAARVRPCVAAQVEHELARDVDQLTSYGDAGRTIPEVFVLWGDRIANFSGVADLAQLVALARAELRDLDPATSVLVIACPRSLDAV
jgi:N-methylhydantoinase A/oxoprolinase/acetone carboxylase beta subunit